MTKLQKQYDALRKNLETATATRDALIFDDDAAPDALESANREFRALTKRSELAASLVEAEQTKDQTVVVEDSASRELRAIRAKVTLTDYSTAAADRRAVDGAAGEYCEALGIGRRQFPVELLAGKPRELRADTAVDAGASQASWVDILFGDTAASYIGVDVRTPPAGVTTLPILTTGSAAVQRGKGQDVTASPWVASVVELKPKGQRVAMNYNHVDALRLKGLVDALTRNMGSASADAMDKAVLSGDSGANPPDGDIVGLNTATGVTEVEITQANKILGAGVGAALAAFIDGKHASTPGQVKIAASVGSNTLWMSRLVSAGNSVSSSLAQYLRAQGFDWMVREGIDTATAAGDFGGYVGLGRQQSGAGVAAIWPGAEMRIIDPYTDASGGTVTMTLNLFWDWAPVRASSFGRIKYVA